MRLRNGGKGEASFCIYRRVLLCRPEKKAILNVYIQAIREYLCFLRPLRMAASSKKPPISHEDVNSLPHTLGMR
jgi:hypothetical protein